MFELGGISGIRCFQKHVKDLLASHAAKVKGFSLQNRSIPSVINGETTKVTGSKVGTHVNFEEAEISEKR